MNSLQSTATSTASMAQIQKQVAIALELKRRGIPLPLLAEIQGIQRQGISSKTLHYQSDPLAFVADCIFFPPGQHPTSYQLEALSLLYASRRVAIRSPHGAGKTALAAWVTLWASLTSDDCKVITTASAWRQLTHFLWPEVHKWARRVRWDALGRAPLSRDELLQLSLKPAPGVEAFAAASDNPAYIEGAHAHRVVYVLDEAKTIPSATWDAVEGAFSGAGRDTANEAYALAISTPGDLSGRFYDIHRRAPGYEDWHTRHVTLDEAIQAGRISREWAEQRLAQWGAGSAVYQNRVLGEFATSSASDVVIPLAWVEAANRRWQEWEESGERIKATLITLGVDVGGGGDDTVLALAAGARIVELRRYPKGDTMETVGRIVGLLERLPHLQVYPDSIGIGAGIVHRLREIAVEGRAWGLDNILPFNAAEATDRRDRSGELSFPNKRSAMWWMGREMLDPASGNEVALPPDDNLTGELTAPTWKTLSRGQIQVEGKDAIRGRIGRSTDSADAVLQALVGPILVLAPRAKVIRLK